MRSMERENRQLRQQLHALEAESTSAWLRSLGVARFDGYSVNDLSSIRDLDLSGIRLEPADLRHVRRMRKLQNLDLRGTGIDRETAEKLADQLKDCSILSD